MANVGCCAQIIKHQTAEDGEVILSLWTTKISSLRNYSFNSICSAMVSWISDDSVDKFKN